MGFIGNILRRNKQRSCLNILSFPYHEAYHYNVAKTGHNFYMLQAEGINTWKEWNRPIPSNTTILPKDFPPPPHLDFDLIFSNNKFGNLQLAQQLSRQLHIPIVNCEHTWPIDLWPAGQLEQMKSMVGHINVFISEVSRDAWLWKENESVVIHHGIDSEFFAPQAGKNRKNILLSVVNDWANRDYFCGFNLWRQVAKDLPVAVFGDTPGLSRPSKNMFELRDAYQDSSIFLNTSLRSPIPTVMLEAASCGCAIVSTSYQMTPHVFTHGKDALLSNNPLELKRHCEYLLQNPDKARLLGDAARKTIQEKFPLADFISNWKAVFEAAANIVYKGI